jgi:DNA-binding response OmpR family regulator
MNTTIKSILLVDDDLDDQQFFCEALKFVDRTIILNKAKDGVDAMETLDHITPDVILLDLNMPRMNGVEFLQQLKKSNQFGNIPVIIYSSFLSTCDKVEIYSLGARQFVKKPIAFTETVDTIKKLLSTNLVEYITPMNLQASNIMNLKR